MRSLAFLALVCTVALAADSIQFQPSKITFAKKRTWEAVASKWMSSNELKIYAEQQVKSNRQMIFVDYNGAKYRGLFSDKIKYNGWYYATPSSQASMAQDVAYYKEKGYEPSYICRLADGYSAIFVTPGQLQASRKLLEELGIGPPTIK